jgi:hypothetical protein
MQTPFDTISLRDDHKMPPIRMWPVTPSKMRCESHKILGIESPLPGGLGEGDGAKFYALYALTRRFAPPSPKGERLSFAVKAHDGRGLFRCTHRPSSPYLSAYGLQSRGLLCSQSGAAQEGSRVDPGSACGGPGRLNE